MSYAVCISRYLFYQKKYEKRYSWIARTYSDKYTGKIKTYHFAEHLKAPYGEEQTGTFDVLTVENGHTRVSVQRIKQKLNMNILN
jgi:hypothetical protein